eukprot:gene12226-15362_t
MAALRQDKQTPEQQAEVAKIAGQQANIADSRQAVVAAEGAANGSAAAPDPKVAVGSGLDQQPKIGAGEEAAIAAQGRVSKNDTKSAPSAAAKGLGSSAGQGSRANMVPLAVAQEAAESQGSSGNMIPLAVAQEAAERQRKWLQELDQQVDGPERARRAALEQEQLLQAEQDREYLATLEAREEKLETRNAKKEAALEQERLLGAEQDREYQATLKLKKKTGSNNKNIRLHLSKSDCFKGSKTVNTRPPWKLEKENWLEQQEYKAALEQERLLRAEQDREYLATLEADRKRKEEFEAQKLATEEAEKKVQEAEKQNQMKKEEAVKMEERNRQSKAEQLAALPACEEAVKMEERNRQSKAEQLAALPACEEAVKMEERNRQSKAEQLAALPACEEAVQMEERKRQSKAEQLAALPAAPEAGTPGSVAVKVRLPAGSTGTRRFEGAAPLAEVYAWAALLEDFPPLWEKEDFRLVTSYPKTTPAGTATVEEVAAGAGAIALIVEAV